MVKIERESEGNGREWREKLKVKKKEGEWEGEEDHMALEESKLESFKEGAQRDQLGPAPS